MILSKIVFLEIFLGFGLSWVQLKSLQHHVSLFWETMGSGSKKKWKNLFLKRFAAVGVVLAIVFYSFLKLKLTILPFIFSYIIFSFALRYYFWREAHV
jgi:hypothetical protein